MKKYYIVLSYQGHDIGYPILAINEKTARNKAIKRGRFAHKDSSISEDNIKSVTYEGFYLARRYFAVNSTLNLD